MKINKKTIIISILVAVVVITPVLIHVINNNAPKKAPVLMDAVQPGVEVKEAPILEEGEAGKAGNAAKTEPEKRPKPDVKPEPKPVPEPVPQPVPEEAQDVQSNSESHAPIYIATGMLVVALGTIMVVIRGKNKQKKTNSNETKEKTI